jgi:glucose/arabinose dehydrogenase
MLEFDCKREESTMLFPKFSFERALLSASAALLLFLPTAGAQSQSDNTSVAEAARRAREQKKNAAKPVRTLTNDDLPAASPSPAAVSAPAADAATSGGAQPEAGKAAPAKAEPTGQTEESSKKRARMEAALAQAKAEFVRAQGELDVLERKAVLDSDAFYAKTDYARDTEGQARLDTDAQQVNNKKSQVNDLKAKVAALQAELGEAAEADKPSQPL